MTHLTIASEERILNHCTRMTPIGMWMDFKQRSLQLYQIICSTTHLEVLVIDQPMKRGKFIIKLSSRMSAAATSSKGRASIPNQHLEVCRVINVTQITNISALMLNKEVILILQTNQISIRSPHLNPLENRLSQITNKIDLKSWASKSCQARKRISQCWTDLQLLRCTLTHHQMPPVVEMVRMEIKIRPNNSNLYTQSYSQVEKV